MELEVLDFFRLVDALSPRACEFLKEKFKLGPSKRHMKKLNSREASVAPFECDSKTKLKKMIDKIRIKLAPGQRLSFSLEIDTTKVAGCVQVNIQHKVACGDTKSNHWISTLELTREDMNLI